jgi:hypothetical protein
MFRQSKGTLEAEIRTRPAGNRTTARRAAGNSAEIAYREFLSAPEGPEPAEKAVKSGRSAWSNGKSEIPVSFIVVDGSREASTLPKFWASLD